MDGQTIAVVVAIVLAGGFIAWRAWRRLRGTGACGCEHCPKKGE